MKRIGVLVVVVALAGCDKKKEQAAPAPEQTTEKPAEKKEVGAAKAPDAAPPRAAPPDAAPLAEQPPGMAPPTGVLPVWKVPAVGTVRQVDERTVLELGANRSTETEQRRVEVVAVDGDRITAVRLTYVENTTVERDAGMDHQTIDPITGKTFLVTRPGARLEAVREPDGTPATPEELDEIESDVGVEVGDVPGLAELLAGRSWKFGEEVTLSPAELAMAMRNQRNKLSSIKVTALDNVRDVARFRLAVELPTRGPTFVGTWELTVDATTLALLEEKMDGAFQTGPGEVAGTASGTVKHSTTTP